MWSEWDAEISSRGEPAGTPHRRPGDYRSYGQSLWVAEGDVSRRIVNGSPGRARTADLVIKPSPETQPVNARSSVEMPL
jgi:hypothetical protein